MVELLVAVSAAALACTSPDGGDGGATDGGVVDAGTPDAGVPDAGIPDAGTPDAGTPDAGTPDAGTSGDYKLDPPNPCYAHWDLGSTMGCKKGDPTSACGGVCDSANACNPPETSPDKASLIKNFTCPSFMLHSSQMSQAAKDDTAAYGWGDASNPPFNYAVVGHDADQEDPDEDKVAGTNGPLSPLDDNSSSCCQCYQLVFETHEGRNGQPSLFPIPKPLIVQSFNTAAGGGKNFDVFMGAGGFGAFNACVAKKSDGDYPNTRTTEWPEKPFMYSAFPGENNWQGGVKFINYSECKENGTTATPAALESATCQAKIAERCDVFASELPEVTASSRASCKFGNQVTSAYHQNWNVRVRRVECPEALTRVTGCRLQDQRLPKPDPKIQTVADAESMKVADPNLKFRSNYTTTTMQDCCKPTCAWRGFTTDRGLKTVGKWNTFYSCDQKGVPFTAP